MASTFKEELHLILKLKEPSPIFSTSFETFGDFAITRKIYLIIHEVYSWKVFCLEDINETVSGYGNHN